MGFGAVALFVLFLTFESLIRLLLLIVIPKTLLNEVKYQLGETFAAALWRWVGHLKHVCLYQDNLWSNELNY